MNFVRYAIAGVISLALHLSWMLANETKTVFAMPAGSTSTAVSLSLVTPAPKPVASEQKPEPSTKDSLNKTKENTPTITKDSPVVTQPQRTVKAQQPISQPTPKPVNKKQPEKITKTVDKRKKSEVKPKPPVMPTKEPVVTKDVVTKDKVVTKEKVKTTQSDAPTTDASTTKETAQAVNSGVSSKPVVVDKPSFLSKPVSPRYPRIARKRGLEGTATYEIWIDAHGKQTQHILISSSGTDILDRSALDAIKQWEFSSHKIDGVAIAHRIRIPVRFNLD